MRIDYSDSLSRTGVKMVSFWRGIKEIDFKCYVFDNFMAFISNDIFLYLDSLISK